MVDLDSIRDHNGKLPHYSWPGAYPIIYVTKSGEVLCADCVDSDSDDSDPVEAYGVHWEGTDEHCAECNRAIPSAYGNPEDGE